MISRDWTLKIISSLIGLLLALIMGEVALVVYGDFVQSRERMDDGLIQYDRELGWKLSRDWFGRHRHYDYDVSYSTDIRGLRRDPWRKEPDEQRRRVLVIGDSFTFGLGVEDHETFTSRLNIEQNKREFVNAGVPGYAPDQQMLWVERISPLVNPDQILFVIYLGNDLIDIGLPFPVQADYGKPFVTIEDNGNLVLRNVPVPRTAKPDDLKGQTLASYILDEIPASWFEQMQIGRMVAEAGFFRGGNEDDLQLQLSKRMGPSVELFSRVLDEIVQGINLPIKLVLLPGSSVAQKKASLSAQYQLMLRDQLLVMAQKKHLPLLDLSPELMAASGKLYYPHDGHLTAAGHQVVAGFLSGHFEE